MVLGHSGYHTIEAAPPQQAGRATSAQHSLPRGWRLGPLCSRQPFWNLSVGSQPPQLVIKALLSQGGAEGEGPPDRAVVTPPPSPFQVLPSCCPCLSHLTLRTQPPEVSL